MVTITFENVPPPPKPATLAYSKGYAWGSVAVAKYGNDHVKNLRRALKGATKYEQGVMDAIDGKPHTGG